MGFRENLREAIDFNGLEQKELAHKTNINLRSIENYLSENGSIPSADRAVQIAEALGVTVEYLVTGKNTLVVPVSMDTELKKLIMSIKKLPRGKQQIVIQNALHLSEILAQQR